MKTKVLMIVLLSCCLSTAKGQNEYLQKVLSNLEKIESATYQIKAELWNPGDTIAEKIYYNTFQEYTNPNDTTIGASFVSFSLPDTTKVDFCYDGEIKLSIEHDEKIFVINDFTARPLPIRPITPPFFTFARNIIEYALETKDSITTELKDLGQEYYFKLTIHEEEQVEFFGKAYHMPIPPFPIGDPTSVYELWISKNNDLPYKKRREMSHDISVITCTDVRLNTLSIKDFKIHRYYPHNYQYKRYGVRTTMPEVYSLRDKQAPHWILNECNGKTVSLADIKSKVIVIEFTGIGCGACQAAIPFLKELKEKYKTDEVELIAIDSWKSSSHSLQNYVNRKQLNYIMLCGNEEVVKNYQTGGSAPVFFILDQDRIIRKVIKGYSIETTGSEITDIIEELLN